MICRRFYAVIYIYLKIEYQSETNFIYHENLRFKKKEKSLRKIKESKRMTKTQGNIYKVTKQNAYIDKRKNTNKKKIVFVILADFTIFCMLFCDHSFMNMLACEYCWGKEI